MPWNKIKTTRRQAAVVPEVDDVQRAEEAGGVTTVDVAGREMPSLSTRFRNLYFQLV
jgi:hypothetical protein